MRHPNRRLAIIEAQGLTGSPKEALTLFWGRYNQGRSRGRPPVCVGEVASEILAGLKERPGLSARRLEDAWRAVLPERYQASARVEGLSRGRLRVVVDSASVRYVLSSQIGHAMVQGMNSVLGDEAVKRIDYRLGRPGEMISSKEVFSRQGMGSRT